LLHGRLLAPVLNPNKMQILSIASHPAFAHGENRSSSLSSVALLASGGLLLPALPASAPAHSGLSAVVSATMQF